jgi:AcrR family transcriptional regulator
MIAPVARPSKAARPPAGPAPAGGGAPAPTGAPVPAGPRPVGRPRSAEADEAIVAATLGLLADVGYEGLTMEGVASRAGVGKATVYRRFPNKVELVLHSLEAVGSRIGTPDTGTVRGDLLDVLGRIAHLFVHGPMGSIVAGLTHEVSRNPTLAGRFREHFVVSRRNVGRDVLRAGQARGELRADLDMELALDTLVGWIYYRFLITGGPLDPGEIERAVDQILAGLAG